MAQSTQRIAGQVVSAESGKPIMGANVFVNGTPYGTTTNAKGEFSIPNLPEKYKTVSVSFFGMETQNVPVSAKMLVKLRENSKVLDEAIVVAFGTATKETFTGSVSVIGEDEIAKSQSTNVLESMNGKVAGVQMTNASGQPGQASPSIRVRGISSINAGNAPLVILDGAPYEGDLNNINPQDIESYSVLKDAASCAQYGARGEG